MADSGVESTNRRWRIAFAVPIPMRDATVLPPGGWPPPSKIAIVSRIEPHQFAVAPVTIGLRPWPDSDWKAEVTSRFPPVIPPLELGELTFVLEAGDPATAFGRIDEMLELILESLSFQLQAAVLAVQAEALDITPPVELGDLRETVTYGGGYPIDKFLRDAPIGSVAVSDKLALSISTDATESTFRQALGWYVKSLSTPYAADQYIFLWIGLELFWGSSGVQVSVPYSGRCKHLIKHCPECGVATEKVLQGDSVKKYLEGLGVPDDLAKRMWDARQIMHGAMPFDSEAMRNLPELVQVARAAVAAELKSRLGLQPTDFPQVGYGVFSIIPLPVLYGLAPITADQLDWPSISPTGPIIHAPDPTASPEG